MTTTAKPVRRETLSVFRDAGKFRNLMVELNTTYVVLRLKGKRYRYTITYDQMWKLGAQNAAEERRRQKSARKKEQKQ